MLQGTENVPPVSLQIAKGKGPSDFVTICSPPVISKEVTTTRPADRKSEAGVEIQWVRHIKSKIKLWTLASLIKALPVPVLLPVNVDVTWCENILITL
jgi:hypothetical protein